MLSLLQDVRILDLSRLIPGAYATAKLADLGADVIKVEFPPRGDYMRDMPPQVDGHGILYEVLNRNKRSISLDIRGDDGRRAFEQLVRTADVVLEGGRPGGMTDVRADYETLRHVKPDLIYCSLSGYGQTGPYRSLPSHGANLEAAAGLVPIEARADGTADIPNIRIFVASQAGALHAALGIAAALHRRDRTGEGAQLDVCGFDAAVSWQYGNLSCLANLGELFAGSEGLGPRYGSYRSRDGQWMMFAAIEPKFWRAFCHAAGVPELADRVDDSRSADYGENDPELRRLIAEVIAGRDRDDWVALAIEHGLPLSPLNTPEALLEDPHVAARELLVDAPEAADAPALRMVALPIKVAGDTFAVRRRAPAMGADGESILAELAGQENAGRS